VDASPPNDALAQWTVYNEIQTNVNDSTVRARSASSTTRDRGCAGSLHINMLISFVYRVHPSPKRDSDDKTRYKPDDEAT